MHLICLAIGFSGDVFIARNRAIEANKASPDKPLVDINYVIPKEGAQMWFDSFAIPKDAKNVPEAHAFINYIMRPEVHASLTNKVFYANPNKESRKFIKPEVANNPTVFVSPAEMAMMKPPKALTNDIRRLVTRVYTSFKSGL